MKTRPERDVIGGGHVFRMVLVVGHFIRPAISTLIFCFFVVVFFCEKLTKACWHFWSQTFASPHPVIAPAPRGRIAESCRVPTCVCLNSRPSGCGEFVSPHPRSDSPIYTAQPHRQQPAKHTGGSGSKWHDCRAADRKFRRRLIALRFALSATSADAATRRRQSISRANSALSRGYLDVRSHRPNQSRNVSHWFVR